ncbi:MAG TPA: F420-0--gamma-glutamyl ligase, partial [Clostridiales bacterium]|nr:F420-0--gamma-glutamyl ligase [Clostridiales bacterium]
MPGVISRGIRAPIIRDGDDIIRIVADAVVAAAVEDGFSLRQRDIVAVTESVVARADGNYASVDDIADDVRRKLGGGTVAVIFPILSRNRFSLCLRGIAAGAKKIILVLSYPSDEVGNR